eukprot:RCo049293
MDEISGTLAAADLRSDCSSPDCLSPPPCSPAGGAPADGVNGEGFRSPPCISTVSSTLLVSTETGCSLPAGSAQDPSKFLTAARDLCALLQQELERSSASPEAALTALSRCQSAVAGLVQDSSPQFLQATLSSSPELSPSVPQLLEHIARLEDSYVGSTRCMGSLLGQLQARAKAQARAMQERVLLKESMGRQQIACDQLEEISEVLSMHFTQLSGGNRSGPRSKDMQGGVKSVETVPACGGEAEVNAPVSLPTASEQQLKSSTELQGTGQRLQGSQSLSGHRTSEEGLGMSVPRAPRCRTAVAASLHALMPCNASDMITLTMASPDRAGTAGSPKSIHILKKLALPPTSVGPFQIPQPPPVPSMEDPLQLPACTIPRSSS